MTQVKIIYENQEEVLEKVILFLKPLLINNAFYNWGHRFLYDERLLIESLKNAGFSKIRRKIYGKSKDKIFNNVESHEKGVGDVKICEIESLVFEGVKI